MRALRRRGVDVAQSWVTIQKAGTVWVLGLRSLRLQVFLTRKGSLRLRLSERNADFVNPPNKGDNPCVASYAVKK